MDNKLEQYEDTWGSFKKTRIVSMEILFSFPGGLFLSVMVPLNFIHFDHLLTSTSFFGVQNSRYSEYERSGSTEISCCSMISVGKHYGLRQVVKDVAVDKPLVHILR